MKKSWQKIKESILQKNVNIFIIIHNSKMLETIWKFPNKIAVNQTNLLYIRFGPE